mgnify:CR=1 FL=1
MNIDLRIGEGWDVHRLVEGRALILGGVRIPHSHGLLGHSDADALAHAITDALLGAAGLGDIGRHFPDTAAEFEGADSMVLLARALAAVRQAGWRPVNVDSTVIAQAPKLAPYVEAMYACMWEQERKMDDPAVIRAALVDAGLPAEQLLAMMTTDPVKAGLMANTEAAVAAGAFGSPSFLVGTELFFGKDRLRDVEEEVLRQAGGTATKA